MPWLTDGKRPSRHENARRRMRYGRSGSAPRCRKQISDRVRTLTHRRVLARGSTVCSFGGGSARQHHELLRVQRLLGSERTTSAFVVAPGNAEQSAAADCSVAKRYDDATSERRQRVGEPQSIGGQNARGHSTRRRHWSCDAVLIVIGEPAGQPKRRRLQLRSLRAVPAARVGFPRAAVVAGRRAAPAAGARTGARSTHRSWRRGTVRAAVARRCRRATVCRSTSSSLPAPHSRPTAGTGSRRQAPIGSGC